MSRSEKKASSEKKAGLFSRMFSSEPTSSERGTAPDAAARVELSEETSRVAPPERGKTPEQTSSWFSRLRSGLAKTSSRLSDGVTGIFTKRKLDEETLQDLEDLLIQSDLGVSMASRITTKLAADKFDKAISPQEVSDILAGEIEAVLRPVSYPLVLRGDQPEKPGPEVILMVGVNGTGKTTTIGKLASRFQADGKTVLLAAGDTFRAAAVEQLKVWGDRTGTEVVTGDHGADAAGLAFDALDRARDTGTDVLMIDTAGRLQNKADLMSELEKIIRVIRKSDDTAPHHVLLVLDATTGQNALQQVEIFGKIAGVTGIIMTKLDGTARGGILVSIAETFGLPIHAIGVGEGIDDLQPFDAKEFAQAIVGNDTETSPTA
jgi:fused signal recognition particle receptor